jgi:uncharacterized membrane protein YfcA
LEAFDFECLGNSLDTLHFSIALLTVLFFIGFFAGFIDSVAGGGGLIVLPVLLSIGIPPQIALGTNKLQSSFGSFSSSLNFILKKQVNIASIWIGIVFTLVGSAIGSIAIQLIKSEFLIKVIPVLLFIIFFYTLFSKDISDRDGKPKISGNLFFIIFGLLIGAYDGFFGPGTGSFWTAACIFFMGAGMIKATGITKVMNFTSNIVALIIFVIGGNVMFKVGLVMGAGQMIGANLGSGMAIKKGTKFIKPLFLTVVFLIIVKLIYQSYF